MIECILTVVPIGITVRINDFWDCDCRRDYQRLFDGAHVGFSVDRLQNNCFLSVDVPERQTTRRDEWAELIDDFVQIFLKIFFFL